MGIEYVIFDFDGTCTRIEDIQAGFLANYRELVGASEADWEAACRDVLAASPVAGWNINGAPSSAPAGADCYILAGEAAGLLARRNKIATPPTTAFGTAASTNVAPFRPELAEVLIALARKGLKIGFISNSHPLVVATRLTDALAHAPDVRSRIHVHGGAQKFAVRELAFEVALPWRDRFLALAPTEPSAALARPIYLRRGAYFEALAAVWTNFGASPAEFPAAKTLVVGDIYELDLAMPKALGAEVHLITRADPYVTYSYERDAVGAARTSLDLHGVLARV